MKTIEDYLKEEYKKHLEYKKELRESKVTPQDLINRFNVSSSGHIQVPNLAEQSESGVLVHFHGFPHGDRFDDALKCFHKHDYFELIYVYKGSFHNDFADQKFTLTQGDLMLLNPNILHSVYVTEMEDYIFDVIISKSFFEKIAAPILKDNSLFSFFFMDFLYTDNKAPRYLYFSYTGNPLINTLMELIIKEYINKEMCSDNMIQSALMMLFAQLSRQQDKEQHLALYAKDKNLSTFELINYINDKCDHITLQALADKFHYSPGYISKQIFKSTGKRYQDLVQEFRLTKVSDQLLYSDRSINDIMTSAGFKDASYFYKLFKEKYGMTPLKFRKSSNV